jgi:hypothetical protein
MPAGVYELDLLTDLALHRSGIETFKYPGAVPSMPAAAASQMVTRSAKLGSHNSLFFPPSLPLSLPPPCVCLSLWVHVSGC